MAEKKEKVANAEYDATAEPSKVEGAPATSGRKEALEVLAKAGDVNAQRELGALRAKEVSGFKVGEKASKTVYFDDETGKLSDSPVGLGHKVVTEGEMVRQSHIDELHAAK